MEQDAPWDEIARAYRDLSIPLAETAKGYGLTVGRLRKAAADFGWPTRETLKKQAKAKRDSGAAASACGETAALLAVDNIPAAALAPSGAAKAIKPLSLVKRIYGTIDKELNKLEVQTGTSSQDRERASRALSQMVSSLEKAVEMQREITKDSGRKDVAGKNKKALKNAEELRREIADRIERLQRKRAAAK